VRFGRKNDPVTVKNKNNNNNIKKNGTVINARNAPFKGGSRQKDFHVGGGDDDDGWVVTHVDDNGRPVTRFPKKKNVGVKKQCWHNQINTIYLWSGCGRSGTT
jgi:hypothetical protein